MDLESQEQGWIGHASEQIGRGGELGAGFVEAAELRGDGTEARTEQALEARRLELCKARRRARAALACALVIAFFVEDAGEIAAEDGFVAQVAEIPEHRCRPRERGARCGQSAPLLVGVALVGEGHGLRPVIADPTREGPTKLDAGAGIAAPAGGRNW